MKEMKFIIPTPFPQTIFSKPDAYGNHVAGIHDEKRLNTVIGVVELIMRVQHVHNGVNGVEAGLAPCLNAVYG